MKTKRALLVLKVLAKLRGMGSRKSQRRRQSRKASSVSSLNKSASMGPGDDVGNENEAPERRIHDPVDTSHIELPEEVDNLMHHLAEVNHDDWAKQTRRGGFMRKARQR